MKVLYFITSWGHGRGGHFYSLKTIRDAMPFDSAIINIGAVASPVFEGDSNIRFLDIRANYIASILEARQYINKNQVTHLHSFDLDSYFFASILSVLCRLPLVNTKPGGAPPRRFYPFVKYLTVFSTEDYEYFVRRRYTGIKNIALIPNRLAAFQFDDVEVDQIRQHLRGKKVLLRIARISEAYKRSIMQTVALARALQNRGFEVVPIVIGVVQDDAVYELVARELEATNGILLCDEKYTLNAKRMLPCGDFVVGTGRSLMEAAFARAILLAPSADGKFPLLLNEENYVSVKFSNFSGRGITNSDNTVVEDLGHIINSEFEREKCLGFTDEIRQQDFDVHGSLDKYLTFYSNAVEHVGWMFLVINLLSIRLRKLLKRWL